MLRKICFYLTFIFAALFFYRPIEVSDVGWHIATGQWVIQHGRVPIKDPFAITADSAPWIFTQWLGSTLLSIPYLLAGPEGLKVLRDFVCLLTLAVFFLYARRKIPLHILLITITLLIYGLGTRCLARSFIFNFIFISLVLCILFSFQGNRSVRQLYILPVIALIWGNIHLGSFVYGFFILSVFLLANVINLYVKSKHDYNSASVRKYKSLMKHVWIVIILYFLFVGITPYGLEGFLYPYKVFLMPDYINFYKFTYSVSENFVPSYIFTASGIWFWGLFALTLSSLIVCKRKDLFSILLFILSLFLFLSFSRGSDFFSIVCAYTIVDQVSSGLSETHLSRWLMKLQWSQGVYIGLILIACLQLWKISTKQVYLNGREQRMVFLEYIADHPKDSTDFLVNLGIHGNVFCNEHVGSYIIGAHYPIIKTLVDGRQVNQQYFKDYFNAIGDPNEYWQSTQEKYHIEIAILDASIPISLKLIHYLNKNKDWQIINVDNTFVTFVKKRVFHLPVEVDSFQGTLESTVVNRQEYNKVVDLALDQKSMKLSSSIFSPSQFIDTLEEGITLLELGYEQAAFKKFVQSINIDPRMTKQALQIQPNK